MQASKFISMGKTQFHCIVDKNIAVHFELDGSFLLFETSSLQPGIYDQDYVLADEEITDFYTHLAGEPVKFMPEKTVKELVWNVLSNVMSGGVDIFQTEDLPKLTKSVADGLTKSNEAATFYETEDESLKFVCFGARDELIQFMDASEFNHFSCSVLNLYYATNFRGPVYALAFIDEQVCVFTNEDKTCGGIIMGIDMATFSKYRKANNS